MWRLRFSVLYAMAKLVVAVEVRIENILRDARKLLDITQADNLRTFLLKTGKVTYDDEERKIVVEEEDNAEGQAPEVQA